MDDHYYRAAMIGMLCAVTPEARAELEGLTALEFEAVMWKAQGLNDEQIHKKFAVLQAIETVNQARD